jgi:hypothetical protein
MPQHAQIVPASEPEDPVASTERVVAPILGNENCELGDSGSSRPHAVVQELSNAVFSLLALPFENLENQLQELK